MGEEIPLFFFYTKATFIEIKILKPYNMKKLDAYKQAKLDYNFAKETVNKLHEVLRFYGTVAVGNSITINSSSSDKQFVYSVGILNNQINACKELGLDPQEYEESKATVIQLRATSKDLVAWSDYANDLYTYMSKVHNLLDKDELFKLIEIPVRP
jgi:hypothetical protein